MTSDFEGFSIPDFIYYIYLPILILENMLNWYFSLEVNIYKEDLKTKYKIIFVKELEKKSQEYKEENVHLSNSKVCKTTRCYIYLSVKLD